MLPASRILVSSLLLASSLVAPAAFPIGGEATHGIFMGTGDIGQAQRGGSLFNSSKDSYEIQGGGQDVWGTSDDFRFTWTRVSGDASLAADVHINAPVTYKLAKGMLMFRQTLDPGSPYADVAIHADGHITLQYRLTPGGETKDVVLPEHNGRRLRIVRHGDTFTSFADSGGTEKEAGPSITIPMHGALYVGLGVCSHNTDVLQSATFSRVELSRR